jgi:hypothetical protein
MQAIQLYLKNESGGYDRVEMFEDESVTITESIKNAKDISKVFTTFSRQFSVPASKTNNKIFKHYYNYDIQNGFDARLRRDSRIDVNYLPYKVGRLKLDGVDMRSNKPYAYRVTFYGSIVELKDVLGEDKLFSLDALNINKGYSPEAMFSSLQGTVDSDGCLVPLVTHSQRLYYDSQNPSEQSGNLYYDGETLQGIKFLQLKYAIKLSKIIEAIETKYEEITFSADSFFKDATKDVAKLFMWCHRQKGEVKLKPGDPVKVTFPDEEIDFGSFYTSSNKFYIDTPYFTDIEIDFDPITTDAPYNIIIHKNGQLLKTVNDRTGFTTVDVTADSSWEPTPDTVYFEVYIETFEKDVTFNSIQWDVEYRQDNDPQSPILNDQIQSNLLSYDAGFVFNIAKNLPEQNILDFLSSLFKMFNLVAYVRDNGEIHVEPLDDFYTNIEHDISKYIDVEKSNIDAALIYKEIFFKYKDTGSILAEQHVQDLSEVEWGGVEYTDTGNLDGPIYKVEPDFHHMKYERLLDLSDLSLQTGIQYGYCVDDTEEAYLGKPLIMYIDLAAQTVPIGFVKRDEVTFVPYNGYMNMPCNVEDINDATSNSLHFSEELNEYTNELAEASLFERFYKSYIQNVFNPSTRIIKLSAVLPVSKIIDIKLSDVIVINGRRYRINAMDINLKDGRANFELINYYA